MTDRYRATCAPRRPAIPSSHRGLAQEPPAPDTDCHGSCKEGRSARHTARCSRLGRVDRGADEVPGVRRAPHWRLNSAAASARSPSSTRPTARSRPTRTTLSSSHTRCRGTRTWRAGIAAPQRPAGSGGRRNQAGGTPSWGQAKPSTPPDVRHLPQRAGRVLRHHRAVVRGFLRRENLRLALSHGHRWATGSTCTCAC